MLFWNITHNPIVANEMVEGLHRQFPALEFKGSSGAEPHVSIVVNGDADEKTRQAIKNWIFEELNRKKRRFHIALDFRQAPFEYSWLDDPAKDEWRIVK
jgi:hypothetical protein